MHMLRHSYWEACEQQSTAVVVAASPGWGMGVREARQVVETRARTLTGSSGHETREGNGGPMNVMDELTEALYDAILDQACWPAFLRRLADAIGGEQVTLSRNDARPDRVRIALTHNVDLVTQQLYAERYGAIDPFGAPDKRARYLPGAVLTNQDLFAPGELEQTACWREYFEPRGIHWGVFGFVEADAHSLAVLSVTRSNRIGPFGAQEVAVMRALMPHLRRAITLCQRFHELRAKSESLAAALDQMPTAVFVLDEEARVLQANRAAEEITAERRGLAIATDGTLRACLPSAHARLRLAIDSALGKCDGVRMGGTVGLGRGRGIDPLAALVAPLSATLSPLPVGGARAIVFVGAPDEHAALAGAFLANLYALTPAEVRVAELLASGASVGEIAAQLGVSISTVRTHLKRTYAKTETRGQADLVRRILSLPRLQAARRNPAMDRTRSS